MRILLLSWRDIKHPHSGGAEINNFEQAKVWIERGHSVTVFSSIFPGASKTETINNIHVIRKGGQVLGVHIRFFFWYLFQNKKRFDIVIDQFHGIPFFTPLYVRMKIVGYIHEVAKDVWVMNPWRWPLNIIVGKIGQIIEKLQFTLYKKVPFMTVSPSTKKDLIEYGIPAKNITVILSGVTLHLPKRAVVKERVKTFMYLGAVAKDKGVYDAIYVFNEIHKEVENTRLWIVGKGEEKIVHDLQNLCKSLKIDKSVDFKGFVSKEEKFKLLTKAYVFVNPSVREGWGLVNIEASACGTPIVAYNVPGVCDSVLHNRTGILINKSAGSHGLAKACIKLLKNKVIYKKMSIQAKKWGNSFTWEKMGNESGEYLENIVKEN